MINHWYHSRQNPAYSKFKKISVSEDWFEVYQVSDNLFVFYEPRHYEETIVNLLIGQEKAILIDTGCGIGNLRNAVEQVTDKPLLVVNTHTHPDHLGSNYQFNEFAMFDHSLSHQVSENGISNKVLRKEILNESLVIKPWPLKFDPDHFEIPPFKVNHWLKDGEPIYVGGLALEVIHTPGEAADHICLLNRANRVLFCGDILLKGEVWTHLEGGSLSDLIASYRKLVDYMDDFDYLMPAHNEPWIDKNLLPEALAAAEMVASGDADFKEITDPWSRRLKKHSFGRFSIITH